MYSALGVCVVYLWYDILVCACVDGVCGTTERVVFVCARVCNVVGTYMWGVRGTFVTYGGEDWSGYAVTSVPRGS